MDHQPPSLYPQLYSTSGHTSNSESSSESYNPEIIRPGDHVIPDLRHFVRTPKILTREGREQLRNLRTNVTGPYGQRRATRVAEKPWHSATDTTAITDRHSYSSPTGKEKTVVKIIRFGVVTRQPIQNSDSTRYPISGVYKPDIRGRHERHWISKIESRRKTKLSIYSFYGW